MEEYKKKYKDIARTVIEVAFVVCVIVFLFLRIGTVWEFVKKIFDALTPFAVGLVFCYLVYPLYDAVCGFFEKKKVRTGIAKAIASVVCILAVVLVIYGIIELLIPKLAESVTGLVAKTPQLIEQYKAWYEDLKGKEFAFKDQVLALMNATTEYTSAFITEEITPNLSIYASKIFDSVLSVAGVLYDVLIGIVAMVYLLNYKEKLLKTAKRLIYANMPKIADEVCAKFKLFNRIFCGFISGKLLDSLIIGILCFIGCSLLRMPYTLLISVFVGVTNIIPFFGPLIGAIPSVFIVLITDPQKALILAVFILALQQLDGNVIGPKILGDSTGVDSLSVLFAILVGGGLFGFLGMFLAVPTWAFIKIIIDESARKRLEKNGLPTELDDYGSGMHPSMKTEEEKTEEEIKTEPEE